MDGTTVQPGQIWADTDKRSIGRKVRVDSIDGDYANCTVVADRSNPRLTRARYNAQRPAGWSPVGHTTPVLLRRFRPTSGGNYRAPPRASAKSRRHRKSQARREG
jgi:hypothetical protein